MFDILKDESRYADEIKSMDDEHFFKAILAHTIKDAYKRLPNKIKRYNDNTNDYDVSPFLIPESINQYVIENAGYDIVKNHNIEQIADSDITPLIRHQLIEHVICSLERRLDSADVAIAALRNTGEINAETILANSFKNDYIISVARQDSIMEHDNEYDQAHKLYEYDVKLKRKAVSPDPYKPISADFLKEFGLLREHIENGKTNVNDQFFELWSNQKDFTLIEILENGKEYSVLFKDENLIFCPEGYNEYHEGYQFFKMDGKSSFEINGVSYEASPKGITVLEMNYIGNRNFTLQGNAEYDREPETTPEPKKQQKFKP